MVFRAWMLQETIDESRRFFNCDATAKTLTGKPIWVLVRHFGPATRGLPLFEKLASERKKDLGTLAILVRVRRFADGNMDKDGPCSFTSADTFSETSWCQLI